LKPLARISDVVSQITRRHLNTRIDLAPLPVEIVSLAVSFNTMLGRLEESFSRLSHYSANLAHEIRTPINNLMVEADIALSRPREPEEYRKVISSSMDEYARLALTIDRLLFLARADSEQNELVVEPLDLHRELEDVIDFYADMAIAAGIELVCHGNARLSADQTLFRRAVSNLVANALAYTPRGGEIAISAHQAEDFSVTVDVRDTGCGIDRQHLPRIFDRFYRVEGTSGKEPAGSGLGLAIVKAIMSMHGGTVAIQSEAGQGTTVTLKFPPPNA
jgi:two-component system heavy metal sensor histidine kinase CusS